MFWKVLKLIKVILIAIIWTLLYAKYGSILLAKLTNFEFFNKHHWYIIQNQWNRGWTISSGKEYALISGIILFIPIWLTGLILTIRTNLIVFIIYPIRIFDKVIFVLSGNKEEHRYVLLNMIKTTKLKETIDQYITPRKSKTELIAEQIRVEVRKKVRIARENGEI